MPQSLAQVRIHLVFSTKHRSPDLVSGVRPALHSYLATVLTNLECPALAINAVDDHVHLLFGLARTVALSKVVEKVKSSSSRWLKSQDPALAGFAWQAGYGAFSVSASQVATVRAYITRQEAHHRRTSFEDEFRLLLDRHQITYDEQHVWD